MAETVGQHGIAAFTNPSNGDSLDANVVKANDNNLRGVYVDHDSDPGIHVQSSTLAARPAAGSVGRKWMTTDTGAIRLWYDTGLAWEEITYALSSALTTLNASNLTSGTVPDARFPAVLPAVSGANLTNLPVVNAGSLTGTTLASNVINSSLTNVGTLNGLTVTGTNGVKIGIITGSTRGIRFGADNTSAFVEGVDQTGVGSYEPLIIGGNNIALSISGTTKATIDTNGLGMADNQIIRPVLKDYGETRTTPSISSGTLTLNLENGNVFGVSLNANITTLTIQNPSASGTACSFTLALTADGTLRTITWGSSVKWPAGVAPTMTSTNGKVDIFTFVTWDAGTNWYAFVAGQNF